MQTVNIVEIAHLVDIIMYETASREGSLGYTLKLKYQDEIKSLFSETFMDKILRNDFKHIN